MEGERIQKVMAEAGIASRRASEDLIRQGRVMVNGKVAELGQRVVPEKDRLEVDGSRVPTDHSKVYYMVNKPEGVITSSRDPEGRPTVLDLVASDRRVFPVGRLDAATEGLLLLTNDGELSHRLTHPSFQVPKTYIAQVSGAVTYEDTKTLKSGVKIDNGRPAIARDVKILGSTRGRSARSVVEITVHEGRKHVVRLMLEAVGHPVTRLSRTAIAGLKIGRLATGTFRKLTSKEVALLYDLVGL
ncbi:MAG: rRNA pseudouridine synthase [Actinobacteria bacterium]|nr:rRNA pseudouridine synthase [Actinomycetota bacterium]